MSKSVTVQLRSAVFQKKRPALTPDCRILRQPCGLPLYLSEKLHGSITAVTVHISVRPLLRRSICDLFCLQGYPEKGLYIMINIQNYVQAESLEEAYQLNQKKSGRIIGGMLWMKMARNTVGTAIDLCRLGLDAIEETEEEFSIGAMVALHQLETHPGLNAYTCGAAARAVQDIIGVQFRNMATVGGSIWGRFGFSDVLTLFLAMDSYVELYKGGIIPLETFAAMKQDNDILVRILVRKKPGLFTYQAMRIQRTDFPVLTCALSQVEGEYRAVIGARPGRAMVIRDKRELLKDGITEGSARAFAAYTAESVPTGSNVRGSAAYRTHLVNVLAKRSALELGGMQKWN